MLISLLKNKERLKTNLDATSTSRLNSYFYTLFLCVVYRNMLWGEHEEDGGHDNARETGKLYEIVCFLV